MIKTGKQIADKDIENAAGGQIAYRNFEVQKSDGSYWGQNEYEVLSDVKNEKGEYESFGKFGSYEEAQRKAKEKSVSDKITVTNVDLFRPLDSQQQGTN